MNDEYQTPTEPTELSAKDSEVFIDAVLNPKEPNERLKALFAKSNEALLAELLVNQQKGT
jgi:Protein of unknown function (DUF1778)